MTKKLLLAALAGFAVAAQGSAKELDQESLFNLKVSQALEGVRGQAPIQDPMVVKRALVLRNTLAYMYRGGRVGGGVGKMLKNSNARIEFRKQAVASSYECPSKWVDMHEGCPMTIFISESVPLSPRVLAPLLAREAVKFMPGVSDIMTSAQRSYMGLSIEVRTWLEMGGRADLLPLIDVESGYKDEDMAAKLKIWLDNKPEVALRLINSILDDVKVAGKRFEDFLNEEESWRQEWQFLVDNDRM